MRRFRTSPGLDSNQRSPAYHTGALTGLGHRGSGLSHGRRAGLLEQDSNLHFRGSEPRVLPLDHPASRERVPHRAARRGRTSISGVRARSPPIERERRVLIEPHPGIEPGTPGWKPGTSTISACAAGRSRPAPRYPCQDSNLGSRVRSAVLCPLSYRGLRGHPRSRTSSSRFSTGRSSP